MNMHEIIKRDNCTVCGRGNLNFLITTPPLPIFQGCVTEPETSDIKYPQNWVSCDSCGTVQLSSLLPLDLVYSAGHAASFGNLWDQHHAAFARFIIQQSSSAVFGVGAGVGKLARSFRNIGGLGRWYNLEPNPTYDMAGSIDDYVNLQGFLDEKFEIPVDVSTVVFSHCLEHIYNLADMVSLLGTKLNPTSRIVVSWPMIEKWFTLGIPGALNWENTYFCSVEVLKKLLKKHGFRIVDEQVFCKGHSIFMAFMRDGGESADEIFGDAENSRALVTEYFHCFEKQVVYVKQLLVKSPQPFWMMPASVYSQYPYAFGLNECEIKGILDDSSAKQGQRLYGTSLNVISPAELPKLSIGTVILNGGGHSKEIIEQLAISHPGLKVVNIQDALK